MTITNHQRCEEKEMRLFFPEDPRDIRCSLATALLLTALATAPPLGGAEPPRRPPPAATSPGKPWAKASPRPG